MTYTWNDEIHGKGNDFFFYYTIGKEKRSFWVYKNSICRCYIIFMRVFYYTNMQWLCYTIEGGLKRNSQVNLD